MNKFDGDMLSVGGVGAAAEGKQTASPRENARTWSGRLRRGGRPRERKSPRRSDCARSRRSSTWEVNCDVARTYGCHGDSFQKYHSNKCAERIADQHVHNPAAAVTRCDQNCASRLFAHFADDLGILASGSQTQGVQCGIRVFGRDHCEELAFIRNVQRIES